MFDKLNRIKGELKTLFEIYESDSKKSNNLDDIKLKSYQDFYNKSKELKKETIRLSKVLENRIAADDPDSRFYAKILASFDQTLSTQKKLLRAF